MLAMIEIATGVSIEPPIPWMTRKTTSQPRFGDSAHSNDPSMNMTRPMRNTRLRPTRSAVDADSMRSDASVQGVRVNSPRERRDVCMKLTSNGGQGDVDRGEVDADEQHCDTAHEQGQASATRRQFGHSWTLAGAARRSVS